MLKSDAEKILRRYMLETNAQFSDEQIQCLAIALLKITEDIVEEALSLYRPKK
jgi:hypothetical protein